MTEAIIQKLRELFPEASVGRKPVTIRHSAIVVRSRPAQTDGQRRAERVSVTFLAPGFTEARRMYLAARKALVSVGDRPSLGEGDGAFIVRENAGEGGAGFIARTGLYRIGAVFTVTGY